MIKHESRLVTHAVNFVAIVLIVVCFLTTMLAVQNIARDTCFDRIEETASQVNKMFAYAMADRLEKLNVFADILAANSENPESILQTYMDNFCKTQYFSALCIHRANGVVSSYGEHPHSEVQMGSFEEEVARLPYVSAVYAQGDAPADRAIYQAVPIVRDGQTIAILYGYTTLDVFPNFVASNAYDGQCKFYVVDGDTGDFLLDESHDSLGSLYDEELHGHEPKPGYSPDTLCQDVANGRSGYYIFRSNRTGDWYYTYYMPMGINNWSMQLTIDEPTAFAAYIRVSRVLAELMIYVIVLIGIHVAALMVQNARLNREDKRRLHMSDYINSVQRALLNAHNDPTYVDHALEIVAKELKAETVLLLAFDKETIGSARYWPHKDELQVTELLGRELPSEFPVLFDLLAAGKSVIYDRNSTLDLKDSTRNLMTRLRADDMALVPIMDPTGVLKGAIAAVNMAQKPEDCTMLECVTYDFFMALNNLEKQHIITNMSLTDALTGVKNRTCYNQDVPNFTRSNSQSLWCMFIDVNGLHDVNNTKGHKAGDIMLCAVADAVKRAFGEKHTYRIGGDEFVAFALDCTRETLQHHKDAITSELAAKGYSVSIGFDGTSRRGAVSFGVDRVVAEAEAIMYREKWAYYQANNIPSERGHFPTRR